MIGSEFMVWQMGPKKDKELKKTKKKQKEEKKGDKLEKTTACSLSTKEETKKDI